MNLKKVNYLVLMVLQSVLMFYFFTVLGSYFYN